MGNQTEHKDRIHAGNEWRGGERGREEDRDKNFLYVLRKTLQVNATELIKFLFHQKLKLAAAFASHHCHNE